MKLRDIFARIRLVLDKSEADKSEGQAKGFFDRLGAGAKKLGIAMAAAFAVEKLRQWGAEVIRTASEADKVWNRLDGTLKRVDRSMASVGNEIRAAARAMQDTTTVGDEEFADALNELLTITDDYEGSLRNVGVVADLAAAKQIDLGTAAQLVGRAMIGETGTLKRYGIIVREGADAVETMRQQFAGAAEVEAKTFAGSLQQLGNEFGDFKEELGGILIGFIEATGVIDFMTAALKRATEVIQRLRGNQPAGPGLSAEEGRKVREAFGIKLDSEIEAEERAAEERRKKDAEAADKREAALKKEIDTLTRAHNLNLLRTDDAQRALELFEQTRRALNEQNVPLERQIELRERLNQLSFVDPLSSINVRQGVIGSETPTGIIIRELNELPVAIETARSAFDSMFGLITMDAQTAIDALEGVGVALVTGGIGGVKSYAQMKSKMAAAQAIEELAAAFAAIANPAKSALMGENPAMHLKAAAEYSASAVAWRVLGGSGGSGGSARGGNAGGGFTSTAVPLGGRFAQTQVAGAVNIYIDPLDPSRPAYQRNVAVATRYADENFGAMNVSVHPRTGRG